jgi:hypothetical protein
VSSIPPAGTTKGEVILETIKDARHFQNKPPAPSTPSIDGDVSTLTPETKATFIGRQRNGYGKAMGDITLPAGDSVVQRMQALIEEGLKRRGYALTKGKGEAGAVSVVINEFWAWFTPGMWAVTFEARLDSAVTIKRAGASHTLNVKGHGTNNGQVASDANWQLAYKRAFDDFLVNFDREVEKAGL